MTESKSLHAVEIAWRHVRKSLNGFDHGSAHQKTLPHYLSTFAKAGLPDGVVIPSNMVFRLSYAGISKEDESGAFRPIPTDEVPVWMSVGRHPKDASTMSPNPGEGVLWNHGRTMRFIAQAAYAYAFWSGYRISKRIYRVHPTLWEGLIGAKFPGNYPARKLNIPAPAIVLDIGDAYVEPPWYGDQTGDRRTSLIYINLDLAADGESTGDRALNFSVPLADRSGQVQLIGSLNIDKYATIQESWDACVSKWRTHYIEVFSEQPSLDSEQIFNRVVGGALNTLLYILGENEVAKVVHPGIKPAVDPRKPIGKAQRLAVDLAVPEELEIGGQYAAKAIEHWENEEQTEHQENTHSGHSVRPHIRSAHAHLYWTGPGREIPLVKYLPPIAVKGATGEERDGPSIAPVR